ncbi:hypothetical protein C8Q79DRAFT_424848 [Trametes meyenii]|nr:hypothetical protein C8Q79DRAFT_424848 [Trametes meyenii]
MSSTDNATAALYQAVFSANSCGVAVFTILFYDWLLSLGREKRLIWGTDSSKTSASILYFFNRYTIVLNWVLGIITISPVPDKLYSPLLVVDRLRAPCYDRPRSFFITACARIVGKK